MGCVGLGQVPGDGIILNCSQGASTIDATPGVSSIAIGDRKTGQNTGGRFISNKGYHRAGLIAVNNGTGDNGGIHWVRRTQDDVLASKIDVFYMRAYGHNYFVTIDSGIDGPGWLDNLLERL